MSLKFYNTMTRRKEEFKPVNTDFVRMYDCGPTVYWYAHLGNMWRYIMSDLARRVLEYNGYSVKQMMNLTDVGHLTEDDLAADTGEDKMAVAAKREKKTVWEIADFYAKAFFDDLEKLNIQKPSVICKATDNISEMIDLIKKLEEIGFTYQVGKHLVFDLSKFPEYGKLSHRRLSDLKAGARLEPLPGKKNPYDFSLWITDPAHIMHWDSPWGVGYPGWHIECSAMSMKYLGDQLDIHTGGEDNIFPHHENEIAQSESVTGKKFVQFWLHARFMTVEGKKMSKSLRNTFTVSDLKKRGFDPLAFRYLCLMTHYRKPLNFTWESLEAASSALENLHRSVWLFWFLKRGEDKGKVDTSKVEDYRSKFVAAVNDDLDVAKALSLVWEVIRSNPEPEEMKSFANLLFDFDEVLGLGLEKAVLDFDERVRKIEALLKRREAARRKGDYRIADEIRREIIDLGFVIEDTRHGAVPFPKKG